MSDDRIVYRDGKGDTRIIAGTIEQTRYHGRFKITPKGGGKPKYIDHDQLVSAAMPDLRTPDPKLAAVLMRAAHYAASGDIPATEADIDTALQMLATRLGRSQVA